MRCNVAQHPRRGGAGAGGALSFTMALQNAGAHIAFPAGGAAPSLPVALGGLGISVADIAMLYAGIAEGARRAPCV